jgi:flagellar basal body rod protein FlgG
MKTWHIHCLTSGVNIGLYQNAASLNALERWQDAVSQNITSSQITGFKRRTVQISGVGSGEILYDSTMRPDRGDGVPAISPQTRYGISFVTGENQPTGRDLDFAVSGEGFFGFKTPDGQTAYTRAGQFQIRADRTLVTTQGMEVLSESGNPIQLQAQGGNPVVNADGTVRQGDAVLGRIGVFKAGNPSQLTALSAGVFSAGPGANMKPVEAPQIQQGYLEASNIAPLREMVDLVNISRAYEANQKLIQTRDDAMQKTLDALS